MASKYTLNTYRLMKSKYNNPWEMAYDIVQGDYTREEVHEMTLDELEEILTEYNELWPRHSETYVTT